MRYTRNLEALLMGQKLNLYQMGLAKQEYDWLKSEVSKLHQLTVSGQLPLDFVKWYSGMEEEKILKAYERWKNESGNLR
jgi:hypothetical protein